MSSTVNTPGNGFHDVFVHLLPAVTCRPVALHSCQFTDNCVYLRKVLAVVIDIELLHLHYYVVVLCAQLQRD